MSATPRDEPSSKGAQPDTPGTAGAGAGPAPPEDAPMDDPTPRTSIPATLARMALVRRHTLCVNGAYHAPTDD